MWVQYVKEKKLLEELIDEYNNGMSAPMGPVVIAEGSPEGASIGGGGGLSFGAGLGGGINLLQLSELFQRMRSTPGGVLNTYMGGGLQGLPHGQVLAEERSGVSLQPDNPEAVRRNMQLSSLTSELSTKDGGGAGAEDASSVKLTSAEGDKLSGDH
ncbi:hypothetical protein BDZ91DRAFT_711567 [Kalaharituber pfeilii]|nr:hypothetical protein BDZ91DRAFT_711567 [Kalaharituber pfeilii]